MFKKSSLYLFLTVGIVALTLSLRRTARADEASLGPGGAPYPNDAGSATVDVSKYPELIQADYKVFARRCSSCHSLSRPLNSQFLQLTPEEQKVAKEKEPDLFKDNKIWRVSDTVWGDYVKTMQGKPGAIIRESEFNKIVDFLVYDSKARKMGPNRDAWKASRQKLLDDFKASNPKRYSDIFGKS